MNIPNPSPRTPIKTMSKGKKTAKLYSPLANDELFKTNELNEISNSFNIPLVSELPVFIQVEN